MSEQSNIGKGFLKDKLGAYQVNPPESVWNSISASLGGRNNRRLYVLLLATAASVALAITLGINFFGPEQVETDSLGTVSQDFEPEQSEPSSAANVPSSIEIHEQSGLAVEDAEPGTLAVVSKEKQIKKKETLRDKVNEAIVSIASEEESGIPDDGIEVASVESEIEVIDPSPDTLHVLSLDPGENLPLDQVPSFELDNKRDPRWMLGAVMSPLYSFRDADGQAIGGGTEYESGLLAYSGGINVSYRGKSRLAIETGIHFSKMGISIGAPGIHLFDRSYEFAPMYDASNSPELIAITNSIGNIVTKSGDVVVNGYKLNAEYGQEALTNSDVVNSTQVAEQGIEQHLDYLEVPVNLRYTVVDRAFELQLVGGMSTNFLVDNRVTMETASGPTEIGYLTNIRSVNYSGNAGLGMIYHLHEKFSFLLEPTFRYFLNSVNDETLPSTRPYALGIYTGISYTF